MPRLVGATGRDPAVNCTSLVGLDSPNWFAAVTTQKYVPGAVITGLTGWRNTLVAGGRAGRCTKVVVYWPVAAPHLMRNSARAPPVPRLQVHWKRARSMSTLMACGGWAAAGAARAATRAAAARSLRMIPSLRVLQ